LCRKIPTVVGLECHRGGTGVSSWWNWSVIVVALKRHCWTGQRQSLPPVDRRPVSMAAAHAW